MPERAAPSRPTLELPVAGARLRPWHPTDTVALAHHANDPDIARNLRDVFPYPYGLADARRYLDLVVPASESELTLAIEMEGRAAGSISLLLQTDVSRRSAELGYWLGRAFWGRGIATAAVEAISTHGFAHLDLARIYATVFAGNAASIRVLEKSGYALEGRMRQAITKHGRTFDALFYARLAAAAPDLRS